MKVWIFMHTCIITNVTQKVAQVFKHSHESVYLPKLNDDFFDILTENVKWNISPWDFRFLNLKSAYICGEKRNFSRRITR